MITVYTTDIESRVIDQICSAQSSIHIAVAWFTNSRIIRALMDTAMQNRASIHIVVDDNEINQSCFFIRAADMVRVGINIKNKISRKFLHHKFMVIDQQRVLTGSYNFTEKANSNNENLMLAESPVAAIHYVHIFEMLTNALYLDENIALLLRHPTFAQQIISTNYRFTPSELKQYRQRIKVGHCLLADNGYYDQLYYEPGFIFNPICKPSEYEFTLPIGKNVLKDWHEGIVLGFGQEYYHDYPEDLDGLSDYMNQNFKKLEFFYKRKFEHTYSLDALEKKIKAQANIIIEDYLWPLNFAPFINRRVLGIVMSELPDISNDEEWKRNSHLIQRNHRKPGTTKGSIQ